MPTIVFERTAAQMGAVDTTASTIATLSTNSNVAIVPVSLVLHKPAGTAYTVGAGARVVLKDDDNNVLFSVAAEGFLDQATTQSRYVAPSATAFSTNSSVFSLSCTGTLTDAAASPAVRGKWTYEEVSVVW